MNIPYIREVAVVLALAGIGWLGYQAYDWAYDNGYNAAEAIANKALAESAAAETAAVERARAQERDSAERINRLAAAYEQDKRNAEESASATIAGLRAGTLRLQNRWAGCQATDRVSNAARTAAELDAEAADRAASASRIVQAARDADDQIRRLQEFAREVSR